MEHNDDRGEHMTEANDGLARMREALARMPRDRGGRFRRGEETQLRDQEALRLRLQGHSLAEIAERMGVGVPAAHRMVQRGLRDASPVREVAELRAEQAAQIDALIAALWPRAEAGSARHAEVICRLIERKAKLLGLDAPVVTQVEVITRDVLERAVAELEADIARIERGELPPGESYR